MHAGIVLLRIFWGVVYFSNGLAKLYPRIAHPWNGLSLMTNQDAYNIASQDVSNHPVHLYQSLITDFILPNWGVFGPFLGICEMAVGGLLIFGFASRLAALLGALLAINLQFLTLFSEGWVFQYSIIWVSMLCLSLMKAGRYLGLDGATGNTRMI
ncbi:MAG: DoxX family membrane protein [Candidatus Dormibacteraceae bacterium]